MGLAWGMKTGAPPSWVGTGTIFRSGTRYCVLTVRHVAEEVVDDRFHSGIFWPGLPDAIREADDEVSYAPGGIDVAMVVLKRSFSRELAMTSALGVEAVASANDDEIGDGYAEVLAGYPRALKQRPNIDHAAFPLLHLVPEPRRDCEGEGHDRRGMHLGLDREALRLPTGASMTMPEPAGMSGAAV